MMHQVLRNILLATAGVIMASCINAGSNYQKVETALGAFDMLVCRQGGQSSDIVFKPFAKEMYRSGPYYENDLIVLKKKQINLTKELSEQYVIMGVVGQGRVVIYSAGIPVFDGPKQFRMQLLNGRVANVEVFAKTPVDPYTLSDVQDPPRPSHFYFYFWLDNEPKAKCRAEYYP